MARKLPNTKIDYDQSDVEAALAIRDALEPILGNSMTTGMNLPNCPNSGALHFLEPENFWYYFDPVRNLWISTDTFTYNLGRRINTGNNILLRSVDASFNSASGIPIPFDSETLLYGMAADWGNTLATANLQVQTNGTASVYTLVTAGASKGSDFTINAQLAAGQDYITVRTNGLSANMFRPNVVLYCKRFKPAT